MRRISSLLYVVIFVAVCAVFYCESDASTVLRSDERIAPSFEGTGESQILRSSELRAGEIERYDGRYWRRMDQLNRSGEPYISVLGKVALVRGIYEGAWTVDPVKASTVYFQDMSFGGLILALDNIYKEGKNIGIPVAEALKIVSMELRGENASVVNSTLNRMRSVYLGE
ncbi:MAG: hypothetical protein ABID09_01555 [Candidatus Omnitrophota bacterium]